MFIIWSEKLHILSFSLPQTNSVQIKELFLKTRHLIALKVLTFSVSPLCSALLTAESAVRARVSWMIVQYLHIFSIFFSVKISNLLGWIGTCYHSVFLDSLNILKCSAEIRTTLRKKKKRNNLLLAVQLQRLLCW